MFKNVIIMSHEANTEGLNAKFQCFTVLYGIECNFGDNNSQVCTAVQDHISHD